MTFKEFVEYNNKKTMKSIIVIDKYMQIAHIYLRSDSQKCCRAADWHATLPIPRLFYHKLSDSEIESDIHRRLSFAYNDGISFKNINVLTLHLK